ncbi:hypothetical protein WOLCODRAFT_158325 [Wolfiporia cocos MD-104 SS10]|uniref:Uncharacterized protein n=1 Tax=Wolfiporia cocos (strain MD-104) TaxID=742152 RepID=A0A2H3J5U8_WOLCO|nr:hypothetical protein WOLCODRAFT_158325 [Wolfiporia cocos MD-104 SS10]
MLAQRGSRPDDKSQRSVQLRAPIQAQLKSPTWGNEEDDGPTAHPPAGAAPAINRARQRRLPYQPRPWIGRPPAAPCPARLPVREDQRAGDRLCARARRLGNGASTWVASITGPTVRLGQDAQAAKQGYTTQRARRHRPPQQPGPPALFRTNNQAPPPISRPKGKPCPRNHRARGSLCASHIGSASSGVKHNQQGPPTRTVKTRAAPKGPLDNRVQTRTPPEPSGSDKATPVNAASHSQQPPSVSTQGRAKAHSRQGNPPRTKSNGSAVCLNNRATPSADRALTGRAAGTPQGSEAASDAIKPRLLRECRELAQQRDAKPRVPCQGTHKGRGGETSSQTNHLNDDAVTAPQAKTAARETSQAKDTKEKRKNAPMGAERARRARPATYTTPRAVRSLQTPLRHRPSRISNRPAQA